MGTGMASSIMQRRTLFRVFLGSLWSVWSVQRSSAGVLWGASAEPRALLRGFRRNQSFERRYRADAAVIFCGVTIFTRRGVGGAHAAIELGRSGDSTAVALHFAAGSDPSHCAGLNRFGILQEAVVDSAPEPEFAFAGLITDSKEEDLDEAKKALHSSAHKQVKIARGATFSGHVQAWTETVSLERPCTWKEAADLLATLAGEPPRSPAREISATGVGPFLAAIRSAALCPDVLSRRPFLHAGKLYSLELRRRAEGEREGLIRDQNGAKSADFRVFYAAGDPSGLPIRIEYRAKSYLKLVFDADDGAPQPNVTSLFAKEAA
jgi:hypothetical protein